MWFSLSPGTVQYFQASWTETSTRSLQTDDRKYKKNLESTWKGQSWSKQKKEWNFSQRDPKAVQSRDNQKSEVKRAVWSESRNPSNTWNKQSFSKGRRSSGRDVCCEACLNRQQHRWEAEGWLPEGAAGSEWCRIMTSCFGNVFSSYFFWLKIH